jgi:hypothetical protein
LDVFVSLGLLTSRFCRAKWTNRLAFIGSMAMILLFLAPDGELQKIV